MSIYYFFVILMYVRYRARLNINVNTIKPNWIISAKIIRITHNLIFKYYSSHLTKVTETTSKKQLILLRIDGMQVIRLKWLTYFTRVKIKSFFLYITMFFVSYICCVLCGLFTFSFDKKIRKLLENTIFNRLQSNLGHLHTTKTRQHDKISLCSHIYGTWFNGFTISRKYLSQRTIL